MKIATWNIKQAVAPKKPLAELWDWARDAVQTDIMVFTEAKVPKDGVPEGWSAVWREGGIDKGRMWGTVIAARGYEIVDVTDKIMGVSHTWPGAVTIVDVVRDGKVVVTIAGIYGITVDVEGNKTGSGHDSVPVILNDLRNLIKSNRGKKLVIAGDFNLWPCDMTILKPRKFFDAVEETFHQRGILENCSGCQFPPNSCGHMWTHKNGNSAGAKVQNLDYIYVSKKLRKKLGRVAGGVADFPTAWDMSDHAPVVMNLDL